MYPKHLYTPDAHVVVTSEAEEAAKRAEGYVSPGFVDGVWTLCPPAPTPVPDVTPEPEPDTVRLVELPRKKGHK